MNAESRRKPVEQFLILGMTPRTLGVAALTMIGTAATAITLILTAVHNAADQVKQIRDEFLQHPPTTQEDIDRLQQRLTDTTHSLKQDVQHSIDQIDTTPQVTITSPLTTPRAPPPATPRRPAKPVATPAPTPRPTPSPTPAPRLLPPLPPLLP